ncbi:hypothetical protein AKO1_012719 [Acrasis kona]|uniref:SOUL heme-binding protein n=1 Tax=Acrasis kona TaxID=1008807 RepID=A0AAW2YV85_9EUKA
MILLVRYVFIILTFITISVAQIKQPRGQPNPLPKPIQQPPYSLIRGYLTFEIREYLAGSWIIADVGPFSNISMGVQLLNSYFDGENSQKQSMTKTVPLLIMKVGPDRFQTSLYIPFEYQKEPAPKPTSDLLHIDHLPTQRFGAAYYYEHSPSELSLSFFSTALRAIVGETISDEYDVEKHGYMYANYDALLEQEPELLIPINLL